MHNNIMVAGSKDRPPMLGSGRYAHWQSRFLRYIDTRPDGDALRKCILEGPYQLTTVTIPVVPATDEKEAIHFLLTRIGDEIYSIVDACKTAHDMWIAIKRLQRGESLNIQYVKTNLFWEIGTFTSRNGESMEIAKNANPLAIVAAAQQYPDPYYQAPKSHKSYAPPSKQSSSTRYNATAKLKCKEIAKPNTSSFESASEEDIDPEQAQRDKDMQKNLALIAKYFKKLYKPINNNLKTSSNSRFKNVQYDVEYNMFAKERQHSEQPESTRNTCVVEKDDSIVIPDSPDMCDNDIQIDQNAEECDDERVALANIIANFKLDVDENKNIQKQLKKANASLAPELKECKSILAETSRTLGESNSTRDSCLIALQNKQTGLETYKTLNDRTVDNDKLKRVTTKVPITTFEEKAQRRLEVKARSILMMGVPNEYKLMFNSIKDAKKLLKAVEKNLVGMQASKSCDSFRDFGGKAFTIRSDLDTMSMDDLYNNLKVYEPKVKGMSSSSSSTQNMAFVSSSNSNTESTNGAVNIAQTVNTAQAVNTAHGVSTASTQVNVAYSKNIDNLNDIKEMDLRWQIAMLTMRARMFLKKTGRKLTINGNETISFDKSKVECYNWHKSGHFARKCRALKNQDNKNKESSRRSVPMEASTSTSLVSCDGNFMPPTPDLSFTSLDEFVNKTVVENCKAKSSEEEPKVVRKHDDALIIEEWVSDDEENDVLKKKMYCLVVIDDYSRFTWVFFLATKDETSGIFNSFITGIENLVDHKVMVIRCDNETKFKNCKFDGKADEGFFVGYSLNSKAFRVFNSRTRIVEENLHIRLVNVHCLIVLQVQKQMIMQVKLERRQNLSKITFCYHYELLIHYFPKIQRVLMMMDPNLQVIMERRLMKIQEKENEYNDQEKEDNVNSTNNVNSVSSTVNAASTNEVNVDGGIISSKLPFDQNLPALEDVSIIDFSSDDENDSAVADINNLDTTIQVSPTPTIRIHKDHHLDQVIGDLHSGIQIHQSPRGIFINQAKYAQKILIKHGMTSCDSIGTPMATKHLDADLSGTPVDQMKYQSMVGSLMYLTASRPDIVHATCYCARYQAKPTEKHLTAVKRIFRYLKDTINMGLWYPKDTGFELTAFSDSDHAGCLDSRKSTSGGIQFLGGDKYHFIKEKVEKGIVELFFVGSEYQLVDLFNKALSEDRFKYLIKRLDMRCLTQEELEAVHKESGDKLVRAATAAFSLEAEQDSGNTLQSDEDRLKLNELMALCTNLQNRVLDLEKTKTTQHNEIDSFKRRVKKLEKRYRSRNHKLKRLYKGRRINAIHADKDIILVSVQDDVDNEIFYVDDLGGERDCFSRASKSTTITIPKQQAHDKGKGIMIEEPMKPKKKDQIRLDKEAALKLQAKFDEEERLAREKDVKEQEANIVLIEE
nr:retrovirus-related Pol polyprotein from transposon TNT 1-94 [Tanacetum cinerariifolium]